MKVLASATFDGKNHLLTNQSQIEFAAGEVRTRAFILSDEHKLDPLRPLPHFRLIHRTS